MSYEKNKYEEFNREDKHSTEKEELKLLRQMNGSLMHILEELKKIDKKLSMPVSLRVEFNTPTDK